MNIAYLKSVKEQKALYTFSFYIDDFGAKSGL